MSFEMTKTHCAVTYTYRCGGRQERRLGGYTGCSDQRPVIFSGGEGVDTRICAVRCSTAATCTKSVQLDSDIIETHDVRESIREFY